MKCSAVRARQHPDTRVMSFDIILLKLPEQYRLDEVDVDNGLLRCCLSLTSQSAQCPCCGTYSPRVHSIYLRTLTDLPFGPNPLRLKLRLRKYFCGNHNCARRIFAERIPELARPYARRSDRLTQIIADIGCECGGEAGAYLVAQNQLGDWAPNTILGIVRSTAAFADYTPRVLGVDDWAMRRGVRYGTVLCDLEQGRIIELLPDRDSKTLQTWLEAHPGIEVISRDRANAYSDAIRKAAPAAIEVADRFHLLVNVGDALERVVVRHQRELHLPEQETALPPPTYSSPEPTPKALPGQRFRQATATDARVQAAEHKRALRLAKYERVRSLKQQGYSMRQIEKIVPASQDLIRNALQSEGLPSNGNRQRWIEPFVEYLAAQCEAGNLNARALCRRIKSQGYAGHYAAVVAFVAKYRFPATSRADLPGSERCTTQDVSQPSSQPTQKTTKLSARDVVRWLHSEPEELVELDRQKIAAITSTVNELNTAGRLSRTFKYVLMNKQPERLDAWLNDAATSEIPEFRRFADGIKRDKDAVLAAIRLPWSNGPTEGHVNRIKTVKRQMYGRGKLDLLRKRLLHSRQ